MLRSAVSVLLAFFAGAAAAQQNARPDPADPSARSSRPVYESAFSGYRPWAEPKLARWREVNDEVGRIGGHVGHVGQAKPAPKPPAASAGEKRQ